MRVGGVVAVVLVGEEEDEEAGGFEEGHLFGFAIVVAGGVGVCWGKAQSAVGQKVQVAILTSSHIMNSPRLRPSLSSRSYKIRHHRFQEQLEVLWVQADEDRPRLKHNIDSVEISIA